MNEPHKLPPERVDALAQRLHGALKRRRPRTWLIVVSALVLACSGLTLFAWWLHSGTAPPRLDVIAFDVVATTAETPSVVAQLVFPDAGDYSPSLLAGREILFFRAPAQLQAVSHDPQARATTDRHGRATAEWTALEPGQSETVVARFIDAAHKQGSNDQARLTAWPAGSKIVLVDIEETLAQADPEQWRLPSVATIAARPEAAAALQAAARKQYHIAYLAVRASHPAMYPRVRAWVHAVRAEKERFPPGPVLGRRDYTVAADPGEARRDRLNDLQHRFGAEHITFVTRTNFIPGVRTITLDPKAGPPGVARAASWAAVVPLLEALPKD